MSAPYGDSVPTYSDELDDLIAQKAAARLQLVWSELLKLPDGKLLAWDILAKAGMFRPSYSGNAHTNFLEGERNIALWLWGERIEPSGASNLSDMMAAHTAFIDDMTKPAINDMAKREEEDLNEN